MRERTVASKLFATSPIYAFGICRAGQVEKDQRLPQAMVGAECADRGGRNPDHRARLSVPQLFP